jgi:hypothetical protein
MWFFFIIAIATYMVHFNNIDIILTLIYANLRYTTVAPIKKTLYLIQYNIILI